MARRHAIASWVRDRPSWLHGSTVACLVVAVVAVWREESAERIQVLSLATPYCVLALLVAWTWSLPRWIRLPTIAFAAFGAMSLIAWWRNSEGLMPGSPLSILLLGFGSWMLPLLMVGAYVAIARDRRLVGAAVVLAAFGLAWPVGSHVEHRRAAWDVYCDEEGACSTTSADGPFEIGSAGEGAECPIPADWAYSSIRGVLDTAMLCGLRQPLDLLP